MRRLILAIVLVLMLVPSLMLASTGWKETAQSNASTATRLQASGAFYHIDSTVTVSTISNALGLVGYSEISIQLIPDNNQVAASPSCEVRVYATAAKGGAVISTVNGLSQISADTDGDGIQNDATLNGVSLNRRSLHFASAPGMVIVTETTPGAGEQCIVWVSGRAVED